MKIKIKLNWQELNAFLEMIRSAIQYYHKRVLAPSNSFEILNEILIYQYLNQINMKLSVMKKKGELTGKYTFNCSFNMIECFVIAKSEIPIFNNTFYFTVKQRIFDLIQQECFTQQMICFNKLNK